MLTIAVYFYFGKQFETIEKKNVFQDHVTKEYVNKYFKSKVHNVN